MSAQELETDHYDAVVLGTGLAESIAAAALAKSGKTVLHLDPNEYYGGEQASLTLDELVAWAQPYQEHSSSNASSSSSKAGVSYSHASTSSLVPELEVDQRRYALSLFPTILPSRGALIDTLIASDVSKYVSFRLLDSVSVWDTSSGEARRVPGSKEKVFKDKSVSLPDKRRLMKFLMFAAGEFEEDDLLRGKEKQALPQFLKNSFSIPAQLAESITYAIAHCSYAEDETLPALIRTRRYLRSIGRYGPSGFLVGQYGGAGEVAQGFCRACAVFGGTYVLGSSAIPSAIEVADSKVTLRVPCHPRPITTRHLITSPNHLPFSLVNDNSTNHGDGITSAHAIAILSSLPEALIKRKPPLLEAADDQGKEEENDDTAVIVFPPEEGRGVVRAYVMGEGTGSCPAGQYILYLITISTATSSPKELLRPYLTRLTGSPLFEAYYASNRSASPAASEAAEFPIVTLRPYAGAELLTEGLDWEAEQGRIAFEKIIGSGGKGFFEKDITEEEMDLGEDM